MSKRCLRSAQGPFRGLARSSALVSSISFTQPAFSDIRESSLYMSYDPNWDPYALSNTLLLITLKYYKIWITFPYLLGFAVVSIYFNDKQYSVENENYLKSELATEIQTNREKEEKMIAKLNTENNPLSEIENVVEKAKSHTWNIFDSVRSDPLSYSLYALCLVLLLLQCYVFWMIN